MRNINRMNDLIPSARAEGEILYEGLNILGGNINVVSLRREIGMVFQNQILFRNRSMQISHMH